jgi:hypothetical protein
MSLLTMIQDAADEIGITAPTSVISNTDATAVRMLRMANRTGKSLAKKDWDLLIKQATVTTSSGEPQYALESDYRSIVPNTIWNRTTDQQVFLATPKRWAYEKSVVTSNYFDRMRLLGDDGGPDIGQKITIHPTPTATETIAYEYYSQNWLTDSGGSNEYSAFQADSDVVVFDEETFTLGIVWLTMKSMGQPYAEERAEFDNQVEIDLAQQGGTENLHADGHLPTLSNIPETGFG